MGKQPGYPTSAPDPEIVRQLQAKQNVSTFFNPAADHPLIYRDRTARETIRGELERRRAVLGRPLDSRAPDMPMYRSQVEPPFAFTSGDVPIMTIKEDRFYPATSRLQYFQDLIPWIEPRQLRSGN